MNEELIFKYFPELDDLQRERFARLYPLYLEWNARINVISRKDIESLYLHHVLHSMAVFRFFKEKGLEAGTILDIGTGGGFPGIPLAIAMPQVQFTLCDSIAKKIKVVTAVSETLGLKNVTPVWGRSESLDAQYDYVVSRAVTDLSRFMDLSRGLYRKGIIYLKGGDLEAEIADAVKGKKIRGNEVSVREIPEWFGEDFFQEKKLIFICNF